MQFAVPFDRLVRFEYRSNPFDASKALSGAFSPNSGSLFLMNLCALFARLGQADGDCLFAALHLPTFGPLT